MLLFAACSGNPSRELQPLSPSLDGHLEEPADAGFSADSSSGSPDLGRAFGSVDLSPVTITGCNGLVNCLSLCNPTDNNCFNNCFIDSTPQAQTLFNNVNTCFDTACPRVQTTDPCADPSSAACGTCLQNAQSTTCAASLSACENDLP